jgi:hypothetical protein
MGKKNKLRRPCLFAVIGTGIGAVVDIDDFSNGAIFV